MRPVEALHHPVGLGAAGRDQAVIDGVVGRDLVEGMLAGRRRWPVAQKPSVNSLPSSVRTSAEPVRAPRLAETVFGLEILDPSGASGFSLYHERLSTKGRRR